MIPYELQIPGTDVTFSMVPIPGGTFRMGIAGHESRRHGSEGPQIEVQLDPYWVGKYEVTWGEYECYEQLRDVFRRNTDLGIRPVTDDNLVDAVTAPTEVYYPMGRYPDDKRMKSRHPAVSMTQYAARQYTKWLSQVTGHFYRLPSEAEWECACRAGSSTAYSFGDDPGQLGKFAWYCDNSQEDTHPVGEKKPNAWGLYDMHGNAGEWVLDEFDGRGYRRLGRVLAAGEPPIVWPRSIHPRTVRGGSWEEDAEMCRSAARRGSSVDWQEEEANVPLSPWWLAAGIQRQIGFRIVRPLVAPEPKSRARYWDADVKQLRDDVEIRCFHDGRGYIGIVDAQPPLRSPD